MSFGKMNMEPKNMNRQLLPDVQPQTASEQLALSLIRDGALREEEFLEMSALYPRWQVYLSLRLRRLAHSWGWN
jgi:hypothetical protein